MRDDRAPEDSKKLSDYLKTLRAKREELKTKIKVLGESRKALSQEERKEVLKKTGGRCHVCGESVAGGCWEADHVCPHSGGGEHSVGNYFPAHRTCNNYRWNYLPEEFQKILHLGVWLRTQIEKQTSIGRAAGDSFAKYEQGRLARRALNPN